MKNWIYIITLLAIAIVGVLFLRGRSEEEIGPQNSNIISFTDCARSGYPVSESYPRQCRTPDGRIFAEELPKPDITYSNASADLIQVDLPQSDSVVGKDFSVMGQARGSWFFEASFPVEVLDKNGKILATAIAQAQSEWMTADFVPFRADLKVPQSYIGSATLVLRKDYPSGLPANDASVSFPITIEY
jgi:hypothetical protein